MLSSGWASNRNSVSIALWPSFQRKGRGRSCQWREKHVFLWEAETTWIFWGPEIRQWFWFAWRPPRKVGPRGSLLPRVLSAPCLKFSSQNDTHTDAQRSSKTPNCTDGGWASLRTYKWFLFYEERIIQWKSLPHRICKRKCSSGVWLVSLDSWRLWTPQFRHWRGERMWDVGLPEISEISLTPHMSFWPFTLPFIVLLLQLPARRIQPIKSRWVYYPPSNKHFLSGEGGEIIYCLREIPNAIFQRVAVRLFYVRTVGRVKKISIFLLLNRIH